MSVCNSFEVFVTACNRICNVKKPHNKAVVTVVTVFLNSLSEKRGFYKRGYIKRCIYIKMSAKKLLQPLQRGGYADFRCYKTVTKCYRNCYTYPRSYSENRCQKLPVAGLTFPPCEFQSDITEIKVFKNNRKD